MTILAKPIGRGNWHVMTLTYAGPQLAPFTTVVGELFWLGSVRWRVCEVRA